jgi:hypothetical protein
MPFTPFSGKNDPRNGHNPSGRPPEHKLKGRLSQEIWEAMITLSRMERTKAKEYVNSNKCKTYESTVWEYITRYHEQFIDRFCGRIPQRTEITGDDGAPLPMAVVYPIDFSKWKPDQIDRFIKSTEPK